MSAYALPGLFPPFPLEYNIGIGISSCGSSWDSYRSTNEEKTDYEKSPVKAELPSVSPKVDISVKEAKIDALQLIQSLTTTVSTVSSQQSKKRGRKSCSGQCPWSTVRRWRTFYWNLFAFYILLLSQQSPPLFFATRDILILAASIEEHHEEHHEE